MSVVSENTILAGSQLDNLSIGSSAFEAGESEGLRYGRRNLEIWSDLKIILQKRKRYRKDIEMN